MLSLRRPSSVVVLAATAFVVSCTDSIQPPALERVVARADVVGNETFFGPVRFTRSTGQPTTETVTFSTAGFEAPFEIRIRNGDAGATTHRVSSGTVSLGGTQLLGPADFGQNASEWTIPVTLGATGTISVKLASKPGSFIDVWVEGKRSAQVFCPSGGIGTIPNLQDAIDATPSGGTLLVCDGIHNVSTSTINKPMTLRSQNPDGATLRDQDPPIGPQGNGAFLIINGISSGTVRITDIGLIVTDGGIRPTGTFDQIEIDDVDIRSAALDGTTLVGVRVEGSTVPTARVNVSNSRFTVLVLGVWPVAATETNVRTSSFDQFAGGGVVYSNGNTPQSQSFGVTEDNRFTNCSAGGCIRIITTGPVAVRRNHFEALDQVVTLGAISKLQTGTTVGAPSIIEDNVIISAPTGGAPNTPAGWKFANGVFLSDPPGVKTIVRRNRITDAFTAINLSSSDLDARDNVINGGFQALLHNGNRDVTFQRNDAVGLISSFIAPTSGGKYQCNWWGSPAGPTSPPLNIPSFMYTPSASAPIAGTSDLCDPTAGGGIVRVCPPGGPIGGGTIVQTVALAYTLVPPRGTISLCPAVHSVENLVFSKPLTIESDDTGIATVDAGSATQSITVENLPVGTQFTLVRRLRFVGGSDQNVRVGNNPRNLELHANEFHPPSTAPYGGPIGFKSGLRVTGSGSATPLVIGNTFLGGDIGIFVDGALSPNVSFSDFDGQANAAVYLQGSIGGGSINSSTFTNCGPSWCVFTDRTINMFGNTFTIDIARPTVSVVRVDQPLATGSFVEHTIVGVGNVGTDRTLPSHYPITGAAISLQNNGTLQRVRVTNAYAGLQTSFGTVTATDNTIQRVYTPLVGQTLGIGGSNTSMTRNDISDYITTMLNPGAFVTLNLRCNYWGTAAGPTDMVAGASAYTPFSTVPIAMSPGVVCTP